MKVDDNIESDMIEHIANHYNNSLEDNSSVEDETVEWENGFVGYDHNNPNHIIHEGESLCGVDTDTLCISELFEHTRESLLHPHTQMETPDRFCSKCLSEFRDKYDFALSKEDLSCPKCGSQHKAYINPTSGIYKCDCGWNTE